MAVKSLAQSSLVQAPPINSMLAGQTFQDFHHLETVQLGGNAASVTFNNLLQYSGEFRHLQIRATARSNGNNVDGGNIQAVFNGDTTGSNYRSHFLVNSGSSVASFTVADSLLTGKAAGAVAASGLYAANVIDILDAFSPNKNTTTRALFGHDSLPQIAFNSGLWRLTDPIASVLLRLGSEIFVAGSRFSLYGIR